MTRRLQILLFFFCLLAYGTADAQCSVTIVASPGLACPGFGPVTLTATPSGFPGAVGYEWQQGPLGGTNFTPIAGATNSTYTATTAGNYRVYATNGTCLTFADVTLGTAPPSVLPVSICQFGTLTSLPVTGTNLLWYLTQTGGTGSPTMPAVNTTVPGIVTLYVSQTLNNCESARVPVNITVYPLPVPTVTSNSPVCLGSTLMINITPCSNCTYSTTGPLVTYTSSSISVPSVVQQMAGTYTTVVTSQNGCVSQPVTTTVVVGNCADSVWPGDANDDLVADVNDALYLAPHLGATGYSRSAVSIAYLPEISMDWTTTGATGIDLKHADCDGNGEIHLDDTAAISANYGINHPKGVHTPQAKITGLPDLYFDLTGIGFTPGTTVHIPLKLGTTASPMNGLLGLAGQIKVHGVTLAVPPVLTHNTGWLGTNTMSFARAIGANRLDFAYARTNHTEASGSGTIGMLQLQIPANATGAAILYFDAVRMIDENGDLITDYNVVDDTAVITTDVQIIEAIQSCAIAPNPSTSSANLLVSLGEPITLHISVLDLAGKVIWQQNHQAGSGQQMYALPAQTLSNGVYQVKITDIASGRSNILKWIKQ